MELIKRRQHAISIGIGFRAEVRAEDKCGATEGQQKSRVSEAQWVRGAGETKLERDTEDEVRELLGVKTKSLDFILIANGSH